MFLFLVIGIFCLNRVVGEIIGKGDIVFLGLMWGSKFELGLGVVGYNGYIFLFIVLFCFILR